MSRSQGVSIDAALIDATEAAIARWGLPDTTLERIADAAGMSRATIYRRGVSRGQLVEALTARAAEEIRRALWPALSGADTAAQRLRSALEAICAVAEDHLDLLAGLFLAHGEVFHQPGPNAMVVDVFAEPFERVLRDGGMDGTLRQVPPTVSATALFNTVGWGYIHLRASHHWQADTARDAVLDLVLHGVLAHTERPTTDNPPEHRSPTGRRTPRSTRRSG
jgi:AcrR family transcriptional regulator